jgi:hypothetical protein
MLQLALLNRVPFGKFNRASAFPVRRRRTAGNFNTTLLHVSSKKIGEEEIVPPPKKFIGIMVFGDSITAINHLVTTFLFNEILQSLHQEVNSRHNGVMQLSR